MWEVLSKNNVQLNIELESSMNLCFLYMNIANTVGTQVSSVFCERLNRIIFQFLFIPGVCYWVLTFPSLLGFAAP